MLAPRIRDGGAARFLARAPQLAAPSPGKYPARVVRRQHPSDCAAPQAIFSWSLTSAVGAWISNTLVGTAEPAPPYGPVLRSRSRHRQGPWTYLGLCRAR